MNSFSFIAYNVYVLNFFKFRTFPEKKNYNLFPRGYRTKYTIQYKFSVLHMRQISKKNKCKKEYKEKLL